MYIRGRVREMPIPASVCAAGRIGTGRHGPLKEVTMARGERAEVVLRGGRRSFSRLGDEPWESVYAMAVTLEIRPTALPVSAGVVVGA